LCFFEGELTDRSPKCSHDFAAQFCFGHHRILTF
jgi:hypothetical protein